jgi:hypothetical protein
VQVEIYGATTLSQEAIKSFGLTVDSKLSWDSHINKLSRCFHLSAQSLYPLGSLLTNSQFVQLFRACVICKCNYMSLIWASANRSSSKAIVRKIRQAARTVLCKGWQDPIINNTHHILKWFLPHEMYLYNLLCFIRDVSKSSTKSCYFYNIFTPVIDTQTHDTCKNNKLFEWRCRMNSELLLHSKFLSVNLPSTLLHMYSHFIFNM